MNNRFFKTAAKKTLFHGFAAFVLYNILHLLESDQNDETNFLDQALHWIIQNFGIPALATLGSEDLLHRVIGTNIDGEMGSINCLTSIFIALYTSFAKNYGQEIQYDYTIPVTLYSMALYYNFFCSAENAPELLSSVGNPHQNEHPPSSGTHRPAP